MRSRISIRSALIISIAALLILSFSVAASYPKTFTDTQERKITLDKPAERIVTRSPDEARIIVALGYGDKMIASI